ncbi:MAG: zinc-binding dehydrogenase [Acidiferrobacter sp.]
MRAMVLTAFGDPSRFLQSDVPVPVIGCAEVLVRNRATAVNPVDAKLRADGSWAGLVPPVILGYDAAGVIEAVGAGVTDLHVGDAVFYTPEIFGNGQGTYAELTPVPARLVALKPAGLSFVEAAAVPLAGGTAWEAIVRRLQRRPGQTLLILGGAGGVGSFAVQFARAAGARVLATASTANQETLRSLGADIAIDYQHDDVVAVIRHETDGGVDAIFDTVGGDAIAQSLAGLRPFGQAATILGATGDLRPLFLHNQTLHGLFLTRERQRLRDMTPLLADGRVRPLIDAEWPLDAVSRAHTRLDTHHGRGKIVLTMD